MKRRTMSMPQSPMSVVPPLDSLPSGLIVRFYYHGDRKAVEDHQSSQGVWGDEGLGTSDGQLRRTSEEKSA